LECGATAPLWTRIQDKLDKGGMRPESEPLAGLQIVAAELNQMHRHGQLNHPPGLAFAVSLIDTRHEITEGERLSAGTGLRSRIFISFHDMIVLTPCKQVSCHSQ